MASAMERLKMLMGGESAFEAAQTQAAALPKNINPNEESEGLAPQKRTGCISGGEASSLAQPVSTRAERRIRQTARKAGDRLRWCSALRRSQRYLGLRSSVLLRNGIQTSLATEADQVFVCVAQHPFDRDVILLCVDVEADEHNHSTITEIGVATLDTRKIKGTAPGNNGQDWLHMVDAKHFRIIDNLHIRNQDFVTGNPEGFNEEFGTSEFIALVDAADRVRRCFELEDSDLDEKEAPCLRNVVLVGHNIQADLKYLQRIGFDLLGIRNVIDVLETTDLQKALKHEDLGGTSLGALLQEMSIDASNLHNAGNDAAYTLQALVAMALKGLSRTRPISSLKEKVHVAQEEAKSQAEAEWRAWNCAETNSGDGHDPIPYARSTFRG